MTLRVGLTGGMGSGKSTVAKVFEVLAVPVYYADDAAKRLMNEDQALKSQIIDYFGTGAYSNGELDTTYLAGQVFNDPEKLEHLNALVHPATIQEAEKWMQQQTTPYTIKEAALIFESGSHAYLDYVIGVYAPKDLRIHRIQQRDQISKKEIAARMNEQLDEEIKMKLCNFVIVNDEQSPILPQVLRLHETLLELARTRKAD